MTEQKRQREIELKPCPFCGGEANCKTSLAGSFSGKPYSRISCRRCKIQTPLKLHTDDAIKVWNTRAATPGAALVKTTDKIWGHPPQHSECVYAQGYDGVWHEVLRFAELPDGIVR